MNISCCYICPLKDVDGCRHEWMDWCICLYGWIDGGKRNVWREGQNHIVRELRRELPYWLDG